MSHSASRFRVAVAQMAPAFLNKSASVEKACQMIHQAASQEARLVVLPEAFIPGYPDWIWLIPQGKAAELNELYAALWENAITLGDESSNLLCQAAREAEIEVVIGISERNSERSNASLYNSVLYITAQGELGGRRRKLMPTGAERTVWAQSDGSDLQVWDSPEARLGALICWENLMPLARYALYQQGMQVLIAPTWDKSPAWLRAIQHIAREGGVFVVSCCSAIRREDIPDQLAFKALYAPQKSWINPGNSCIVQPNGEFLIAPVAEKQDLLYADLDFHQITVAKRLFDVAGHYAREDVFRFRVNRAAQA